MNEQGRELLSAFADSEVGVKEEREVLDLLGDEARRDHLARYYAIGEAMRGQLNPDAQRALRVRVAAAIAEPDGGVAEQRSEIPPSAVGTVIPLDVVTTRAALEPGVPPSRTEPRRFSPVALAASVAVAAVLGFLGARQMDRTDLTSAPIAQALPDKPAASARGLMATKVSAAQRWPGSWDAEHPAVRRRLESYLVDHSEYLGRGVRGMHPYARVVSYAPNPALSAGRLSGTQ